MPRLLIDCETNGLLEEVTRVHCIVTLDLDTGSINSYFDDPSVTHPTHTGSLATGVSALEAATELWAHNGIGFDLPVLSKLLGCSIVPAGSGTVRVRDSLVCSQHIWLELKVQDFAFRKSCPAFPGNLIGSHSLKAWGWRLGEKKDTFGETADWSKFTLEMLNYCIQDVKTNKVLIDKIVSKNYSEAALENEHRFAYLIWLQEQHGFRFDREHAVKLYGTLSERRAVLERELQEGFAGWSEDTKTPEYYSLIFCSQFAGDGPEIAEIGRYPTKSQADAARKEAGIKPKDCEISAGPMRKKITAFNPGSHDHIANFLIEKYSWKPTQYGADGKASTTEEILSDLKYPEIPKITEYLMVEKRIGQLAEGAKAWLRLEKKGRIHGRVQTNGAVSTRVTHSNPNMSQVPAVDKPYGKESRACFVADEGQVLVGADASGIQLRALGHYMHPWDGGAYSKIILTGSSKDKTDIHSVNQRALNAETRDMAKTFIYAFLLGAQAGKVGSILGVSRADGQKAIDSFLASFPALAALKAAVAYKVKTQNFILGPDKRILPTRSEHAALSSLLQGFEACVMKVATWQAHRTLEAMGLVHGKDFAQVGFFHDELQITCRPDLGDTVGKAVVQAIEWAGRDLGSTCPLTGEYRVGKNWADTH